MAATSPAPADDATASASDRQRTVVPALDDVHAGADVEALLARISDLEQQVASLGEGLHTRQQIGFITGVLAQRHGLSRSQGWDLLSHASQELNVKVRRVAEVLTDAFDGQLDPADVPLVVRITAFLPTCTPATGERST